MSASIDQLLTSAEASIKEALVVIDGNGLGVAFVVDKAGRLKGIVTDGNVRRALLKGANLEDSIMVATNTACITLPVTTPAETIAGQLISQIRVIPLLDIEGRPVDYATHYRNHRFPIMEPILAGNEMNYIMECIKTNWISSQGPFVRRFEKEFADYLGVRQALAVSNGTAALHLALAALGIGPGDEVIVPDLTFAASINAVLYVGATPVLADVNRDTWVLDADQCCHLITKRTRAVMAVHLYGQPVEMDPLMEMAKEKKLYLIEDAAEALSATYHGRQVGTFGDAAAFSFFGNKMITTGEGGMVVFKDPAIAARAKLLRDHGMDPNRRYWHTEIGYNYRLTNLQAAIGVAQLEQIEQFIQKKLDLADSYQRNLSEIKYLTFPGQRDGIRNVYWLFSIVLDPDLPGVSRDEMMVRLALAGIETRNLFYPLHTMPPYERYGSNMLFPNSEYLSANGLSLPSVVSLTYEEVAHICATIRNYFNCREIIEMTG